MKPTWERDGIQLYLGDCLKILPVLTGIGDFAFCDPPFNLDKEFDQSWGMNTYMDWCSQWIDLVRYALGPTGAIALMTIQEHVGKMMEYLGRRMAFRNQIIWFNSSMPVKNRFCIGYQPILWYVKDINNYTFNYGSQRRESNAALPYGKKNMAHSIKDIWDDIPFVSGGCMASKEAILRADSKKKAHPTQMPIALAERFLLYCTNCNDMVLDPFMGSGTTGVACVQTGRKFIGIETDPGYFEIAVRRIEETMVQPMLPLMEGVT